MERKECNMEFIRKFSEDINDMKKKLEVYENKLIKLIEEITSDLVIDDEIIQEKDIYRLQEKLIRYVEEVRAVNKNIIEKNFNLSNTVEFIFNQIAVKTDISVMNNLESCGEWVINYFYQKLDEKYDYKIRKIVILAPNRCTMQLNYANLTVKEKLIYEQLNHFRKLRELCRSLEFLKLLCMCIVYNYEN